MSSVSTVSTVSATTSSSNSTDITALSAAAPTTSTSSEDQTGVVQREVNGKMKWFHSEPVIVSSDEARVGAFGQFLVQWIDDPRTMTAFAGTCRRFRDFVDPNYKGLRDDRCHSSMPTEFTKRFIDPAYHLGASTVSLHEQIESFKEMPKCRVDAFRKVTIAQNVPQLVTKLMAERYNEIQIGTVQWAFAATEAYAAMQHLLPLKDMMTFTLEKISVEILTLVHENRNNKNLYRLLPDIIAKMKEVKNAAYLVKTKEVIAILIAHPFILEEFVQKHKFTFAEIHDMYANYTINNSTSESDFFKRMGMNAPKEFNFVQGTTGYRRLIVLFHPSLRKAFELEILNKESFLRIAGDCTKAGQYFGLMLTSLVSQLETAQKSKLPQTAGQEQGIAGIAAAVIAATAVTADDDGSDSDA